MQKSDTLNSNKNKQNDQFTSTSDQKIQRIKQWKIIQQLCDDIEQKQPEYKPYPSIKFFLSRQINIEKDYKTTEFQVLPQDTIYAANGLKKQGLNPLVLIMANDKKPGGYVSKGSYGQEEDLFLVTDLHKTFAIEQFPIKPDEAIYCPRVHIICSPQNKNFKQYSSYQTFSFVSVPGLYKPQVINGQYTKEDQDILKKKITLILYIAYLHYHDSLVLGSLGCGAFQNDPKIVAEIYNDVLSEFNGVFKKIVFAIQNKDQTQNFDIFKEIFNEKTTQQKN